MRILVISPIFPPVADAESFCSGKFVQGLIHSGHDVRVIRCSDVRRSARLDTSNCWKSLGEVALDIPNPQHSSAILKCWSALRYQSSSWAGWTEAVVTQAQAFHRERPFDLVVSRSLPRHAHLAGYWVSSVLRLPWVANINDPWDFSPFVTNDADRKEWKMNLNAIFWWRRLLARADRITFPCERLRDYCLKRTSRQSGVQVIPHIGSGSEMPESSHDFVILHAGKLGLDELTGRSVKPLLEGVSGFLRNRPLARAVTRLVFVGSLDEATMRLASDLDVSANVTSVGVVNYEESLRHIGQATVCVLVEGNFKEGIFLPSKLCDYIAARKPVLALSPDVGTVNDLAQHGGIQRVSSQDSIGTAGVLTRLFDDFKDGRIHLHRPPEALVNRFEASTVMQGFLKVLEDLTPVEIQRADALESPRTA